MSALGFKSRPFIGGGKRPKTLDTKLKVNLTKFMEKYLTERHFFKGCSGYYYLFGRFLKR